MFVLSWNVQHQGLARRLDRILDALRFARVDLLALQEVHRDVAEPLTAALERAGYPGIVFSGREGPRGEAKRYGNLIASRLPATRVGEGWCPGVPFPESLARITVHAVGGDIDFVNAHIPNGSGNGEKKVDTMRALARYLGAAPRTPRILVGDFNTPKSESPNGEVEYWDRKPRRGPAWREAERSIIQGEESHGLRDVFRRHHGYGVTAISHRRGARGRRYDHLFASDHFETLDTGYHVEWMDSKLSDHAPVWARFSMRTA